MALGRRCDLGCESWPDMDLYDVCPICEQPTTKYTNLRPLDIDEAQSILLHCRFEAYYEDHCHERGFGVDGPLPDGFELTAA